MGDVDHALGSVHAWNAGVVARDASGETASALVACVYNLSQNGSELCITRLANSTELKRCSPDWPPEQ